MRDAYQAQALRSQRRSSDGVRTRLSDRIQREIIHSLGYCTTITDNYFASHTGALREYTCSCTQELLSLIFMPCDVVPRMLRQDS